MTETNIATGIFEGTVFFTTTDESSGHRLRVAEGSTVTAEYEDNTLPDPYTTADEWDIVATSLIGIVTIDESDDDTLDDIIPVGDVAFTGGDTSAGDSETMFIMIAGIAIIITVIGIIIWFRKIKNSTMIKE